MPTLRYIKALSIPQNVYLFEAYTLMQYRTTVGWSLITSGIVTLLLKILPGDSLWWGIALLIVGGLILFFRKSDKV